MTAVLTSPADHATKRRGDADRGGALGRLGGDAALVRLLPAGGERGNHGDDGPAAGLQRSLREARGLSAQLGPEGKPRLPPRR